MNKNLAKSNCFDWNATIKDDGINRHIIEGDFNFEVVNFERGYYPGGGKLPACNKAVLTLEVDTDEGTVTVNDDIILCKSMEWRISSFFRCIGLKKLGEPFVMDWNKVVGSHGRARFAPRSYTSSKGEKRTVNSVQAFYDYDSQFFACRQNTECCSEAETTVNQSWKNVEF